VRVCVQVRGCFSPCMQGCVRVQTNERMILFSSRGTFSFSDHHRGDGGRVPPPTPPPPDAAPDADAGGQGRK
jgi:hypothetical protein